MACLTVLTGLSGIRRYRVRHQWRQDVNTKSHQRNQAESAHSPAGLVAHELVGRCVQVHFSSPVDESGIAIPPTVVPIPLPVCSLSHLVDVIVFVSGTLKHITKLWHRVFDLNQTMLISLQSRSG
jgi:hypothetical protein